MGESLFIQEMNEIRRKKKTTWSKEEWSVHKDDNVHFANEIDMTILYYFGSASHIFVDTRNIFCLAFLSEQNEYEAAARDNVSHYAHIHALWVCLCVCV